MDDKKIRDEYRDKYRDFINNEIIPIANKTLFSNETIELSAYNDAGSVIGINTVLVTVKQARGYYDEKTKRVQSITTTIEYTPDERYYRAFGDLVDDSIHRVKVSNQNSFFDFIAVCINKDGYDHKNFATKEDLFKHLKGLIDDKRYVNQRRAAFEPSKLPEMSVWRQSEYYDFIDNEFTQKLFKDDSPYKFVNGYLATKSPDEESDVTVNIRSIELKQQFIHFSVGEGYNPHVYTSSSKYYNKVTSQQATTFMFGGTKPSVTKIENNNPYFMLMLRCLNKDKKAFEPVLQYHQSAKFKEFKQRELSAYLDGFISNEEYIKEYDVTFVPVEVNPGVDESLKEKYVDFVEKEIKPKIKGMGMVSADDAAVLFSEYGKFTDEPSKSSAGVVFVSNSKLSSHGKKSGQEVYGISDNNPNFKFMQECLNHNSTESKWVKFVPTSQEWASKDYRKLNQYLEGLPSNQQCKEDYLNNFMSLPGSSSSTVSIMPQPIMQQAVFFTWLAYMLSPIINPVFNYISNKIIGLNHIDDREKKKEPSDKPSSNMTEAREQQLDKKGIMK